MSLEAICWTVGMLRTENSNTRSFEVAKGDNGPMGYSSDCLYMCTDCTDVLSIRWDGNDQLPKCHRHGAPHLAGGGSFNSKRASFCHEQIQRNVSFHYSYLCVLSPTVSTFSLLFFFPHTLLHCIAFPSQNYI